MYIVYDGNDVITITPETSYASVRSICTTEARANLSTHATETPENRFLVTPLEKVQSRSWCANIPHWSLSYIRGKCKPHAGIFTPSHYSSFKLVINLIFIITLCSIERVNRATRRKTDLWCWVDALGCVWCVLFVFECRRVKSCAVNMQCGTVWCLASSQLSRSTMAEMWSRFLRPLTTLAQNLIIFYFVHLDIVTWAVNTQTVPDDE